MGGKSQPSPPPALKADELIKAQKAQQVSEFTPYGSRVYGDGPSGRIATTTFSPEIQGIEDDRLRGMAGMAARGAAQVGELPSGPISYAGLPEFDVDLDSSDWTAIPGVGDGARTRVEQATYDRYSNLMAPDQARARRAEHQRLANRGIPIGSEAYNDAMDRLDRGQESARLAWGLESIMAGGREQALGQDIALRNRQFQLSEALQNENLKRGARTQGINERTISAATPSRNWLRSTGWRHRRNSNSRRSTRSTRWARMASPTRARWTVTKSRRARVPICSPGYSDSAVPGCRPSAPMQGRRPVLRP